MGVQTDASELQPEAAFADCCQKMQKGVLALSLGDHNSLYKSARDLKRHADLMLQSCKVMPVIMSFGQCCVLASG